MLSAPPLPAISLRERIIEPEIPIIDAHHHLWYWPLDISAGEPGDNPAARSLAAGNPFAAVLVNKARYLLDDYLADVRSGHNVVASIFVDSHAMYRRHGPEDMRSIGEIEFVSGVAAMCESGLFGETRVAAGIVGNIDLRQGGACRPVIEAHIQAAGGRYRGIRNHTIHDPHPAMAWWGANRPAGVLLDPRFREGFELLSQYGLSYDAWVFETQLGDVEDLARSYPGTQIVLNHTGGPLGVDPYRGLQQERFPAWRDGIRRLSQLPNVAVKIGGLGMPLMGFKAFLADPPQSSEEIAADWKPYVETCVEAFGAARCMFESNHPVDAGSANYATIWNVFKQTVAGASDDEKRNLFALTAKRIYRLDIDIPSR